MVLRLIKGEHVAVSLFFCAFRDKILLIFRMDLLCSVAMDIFFI